jgi:hypothetical protein
LFELNLLSQVLIILFILGLCSPHLWQMLFRN